MEEREENPHERLKQKLSELEQEWIAMKTGKSSSAIPLITVEKAMGFVENSPRELMLSLQQDQASQLAEMIQIRSPFRRKLFHDYSDEIQTASSCLSSNVTRVRDNNNKKKKKSGRRIVTVISMVMILLLLVLVVLMNGFDHLSMDRQIHTLVPT